MMRRNHFRGRRSVVELGLHQQLQPVTGKVAGHDQVMTDLQENHHALKWRENPQDIVIDSPSLMLRSWSS
jgi:hypothetical protein